MNDVIKALGEYGIVPVVVLNDAKDAEPLAKALCEGGLKCAEVTFRTAAAEESIKIMAEKFPDMLVGAGTVLTTEQVDRAVAAGAKFIVSPGLNPKVVKYCVEKGIPVCPGTCTPSYTMLKFMPTGGVNATNVRDYLAYDKILCCGGSWMVKGSLIEAGEFDKIVEMTKEAAAIVKEVRG